MVTAPEIVPVVAGLNVRAIVQSLKAARELPHGAGPPGTAVYCPLVTMLVMFNALPWLLVMVRVCGALVVPTVCAAKVKLVGAKVTGRMAVPETG